jgi:hypothetical protein
MIAWVHDIGKHNMIVVCLFVLTCLFVCFNLLCLFVCFNLFVIVQMPLRCVLSSENVIERRIWYVYCYCFIVVLFVIVVVLILSVCVSGATKAQGCFS